MGLEVEALEKEVAEYCGTKYGVGVASGTDALKLSLVACGIKPGDEVITTNFSFIATADTIAQVGAKPVFVDINPQTFNIDENAIEQKITSNTKAIIPVHLYGQPAVMDKITAVAKEHGLKVIEDCAQAIGAEFVGKRVSSFGDAGCLSFFPSKNLGCMGDGGIVVTNDEEVAISGHRLASRQLLFMMICLRMPQFRRLMLILASVMSSTNIQLGRLEETNFISGFKRSKLAVQFITRLLFTCKMFLNIWATRKAIFRGQRGQPKKSFLYLSTPSLLKNRLKNS